MADEAVEIRITAKNGTEQVFRAIQTDSDRIARSLKEAGADGNRAMEQIERGAKEASQELQRAERQARTFGDRIQRTADFVDDFGAGMVALGAGLVYAGNKAMEQERQIIGLRSAFGDAADEMIRFAEELDEVTIFSDDDIRAGERYFASLRNNYDLSIQQIQDLMRTTADLASAAGISFEDASSRVTAAIRGEGEAAEYLGLTMNQQAIDRENLTLTMTNQEAAQFRLNALNQQAAVYQGTAQEVAAGSIGTYAELTDTVNDWAAAAGNFIGPWGSVISGIGLGAAGVTSLVGGLGRMTAAMRNSTVAATGLNAALKFSPWIAAATAGAAAAYALNKSFEEGETVASRFGAAIDDLASGDVIGFFETLATGVDSANGRIENISETLFALWDKAAEQQALGNSQQADFISHLAYNAEAIRGISEQWLDAEALKSEAVSLSLHNGKRVSENEDMLREAYSQTTAELQVYNDALNALAAGYLDPAVNGEALNKAQDDLYFQFTGGSITLDEYRLALVDLARSYGLMPPAIADAAAAQGDMNTELQSALDILAELDPRLQKHFGLMTEEARKANADSAAAEGAANRAREATGNWWIEHDRRASAQSAMSDEMLEANEVMSEQATILGGVLKTAQQGAADAAAKHTARLEALNTASSDATAATLAMAAAANQAQVDFIAAGTALAGWDDALSQLNLAGFGTEAMLLADGLGQATTALDNTFRIVVGNTNAIGQQVQGVEDWITALGETNDVLNEQIAISVANANVQEDLLSIQAQQAPLVVEQTVRTAAYVDELERMPAAQQAVALGWADANTAAQANEAITIAAAAANGEWGAAGEEAARQWIEAAVGVNPILFDMLENIGLITGTPHDFTINFDGAAGAKSDIDLLNESVRQLTDLLDNGRIDGSIGMQVTGTGDVDLLTSAIQAALAHDGDNAHVTASGDGSNAENAISSVADSLRNLDGDNAHVTNTGDNSDATNAIANTSAALTALDGDSATVYAYLNDFASAGISGIRGAIASLDGNSATVTTYRDTVFRSYGVGESAFALGGTVRPESVDPWAHVATAANGRTVMVGEHGPELVNLPYGSQVTPHAASMSRVASEGLGGGVHLSIPIYGNVYGIDDLTAEVGERLVAAVEKANRQYLRGQGAT